MRISNDIKYIGVDDHQIDLFEGQYRVPDGMSYNSYLIQDSKTAVLDTVDRHFTDEWLKNIRSILNDKCPDYLIIHHMEPDHSAGIEAFMTAYPEAVIAASSASFSMMLNYFGKDFSERRVVVKDYDELILGNHTLVFRTAPMVHWPEVITSYDMTDKALFSADAFGKFGALDIQDDDWACEARRYYFGIIGKFGHQVQSYLKKIYKLDIVSICPLHGPVLIGDIDYYIDLYSTWSSYGNETEGVVIAYTSCYRNTKRAAELLYSKLKEKGVDNVILDDIARMDMAEAIEDAFRYSEIVFASTSYYSDVFPVMGEFVRNLAERNFQNKTVGLIENGSWAPSAAGAIKKIFRNCTDLRYIDTIVTINSSLNADSISQIDTLADELAEIYYDGVTQYK